jgi:predicted site-specific integrase-resolvase
MKKRAVGYIRVSSREQAEKGESLHTQRKTIETYIKSQGWKCTKIYEDAGISGGSMEKRKALQQLLKDAQSRNIFTNGKLHIGRTFKNSKIDKIHVKLGIDAPAKMAINREEVV